MAEKKLSDAKLAELKENARGILADCRRKILIQQPFIGTIIMGMDLIPVRDCRVPTACTDGTSIYFGLDFLRQLKPDERIFVLAHEVWHCVLAHMTREQKREHDLANQAEDVEVNELLMADGLVCPKDACTCKTMQLPVGKNFETYYEILLKRRKEQNQQSNSKGNGSAGGGQGENGESAPNGGNSTPSVSGQFDKHVHKGDKNDNDKSGTGVSDHWGEVGFDKDYNPSMSEELASKLREAVISAAQQVERQRGQLPGHLKAIVDKLLTPTLDWKEILASFISKASGEGRTNWNMPNRRFAYQNIYLPSHQGDKISVGVMLDTSGSCVNDLNKFLSEVNGIVKAFGNYELHVAQCDWEVRDFQTYNDENPLDLERTKFKMHGGGGTQLMPGLQSFEQHDVKFDCIVAFSDLECEDIPENAVDVPLLWVSVNGTNHPNIKCGTIIDFNNKKPAE